MTKKIDGVFCDDCDTYTKKRFWHHGLKVNGVHAKGEFPIPVGDWEVSLNIAARRGIKFIRGSDGIESKVIDECMTRAPLIRADNLSTVYEVKSFLLNPANGPWIESIVESTTRFGKFRDIEPIVHDKNLYMRLTIHPGDAAGHNMAGKAASALAYALEEKFPVKYALLSSNYCCDKKPAQVNLDKGRGRHVIASTVIPRDYFIQVANITPEELERANYEKNFVGSRLAGSLGKNSHHANMFANLAELTGNDVANTVEGSMGTTYATTTPEGDLEFSVDLPCLVIGTIGGGTCQPGPRQVLERLGCYGAGNPLGSNARYLAEYFGAAILASELSTMTALSNPKKFMKSHEDVERKNA